MSLKLLIEMCARIQIETIEMEQMLDHIHLLLEVDQHFGQTMHENTSRNSGCEQ